MVSRRMCQSAKERSAILAESTTSRKGKSRGKQCKKAKHRTTYNRFVLKRIAGNIHPRETLNNRISNK